MSVLRYLFVVLLIVITCDIALAQEDTELVMIKINRIVFVPGNKYTFSIPTFEFHMLFQKKFENFRSAVTADYDFRRKDMGFGMSHALYKYVINPGINIDDNLYFREVFSDSTGIWRRKQAITPFLYHELSENHAVGLAFKFEREWSPKRKMGAKIISNPDRSVKLYYLFQKRKANILEHTFYYFSFERSYKIFKGEFNFFLFETFLKHSREINKYIRYNGKYSFHGNLTRQKSPLFFLGGHSNLIGYNNDEFWGRRVFNFQNLLEIKPFPEFSFSIKDANFRRLSLIFQIDVGQVRGASRLKDLKAQNRDFKVGVGAGFGFNTDLPYMPATDVHFILACPSSDTSDIKFYVGFGEWNI